MMQKGLRAILYLRTGSKVKEFSAIPLPSPVGETSWSRFLSPGLNFPVARGPRRFPYAHPSGFPPRALDCACMNAGEGQALALRYARRFFP